MDKGLNEIIVLSPSQLLYAEIVDNHIYLYTNDHVYETRVSLSQLENEYFTFGLIRCAKTMVVNLYAIHQLKSSTSGRIIAELINGERILISRRYAAQIRKSIQT